MSDILKPVLIDDEYFGMVRISLIKYWGEKWTGYSVLTPDAFAEFKQMRIWLTETNTSHKFEWINTGLYLPDYVWIDRESEGATIFKLKYGLA